MPSRALVVLSSVQWVVVHSLSGLGMENFRLFCFNLN